MDDFARTIRTVIGEDRPPVPQVPRRLRPAPEPDADVSPSLEELIGRSLAAAFAAGPGGAVGGDPVADERAAEDLALRSRTRTVAAVPHAPRSGAARWAEPAPNRDLRRTAEAGAPAVGVGPDRGERGADEMGADDMRADDMRADDMGADDMRAERERVAPWPVAPGAPERLRALKSAERRAVDPLTPAPLTPGPLSPGGPPPDALVSGGPALRPLAADRPDSDRLAAGGPASAPALQPDDPTRAGGAVLRRSRGEPDAPNVAAWTPAGREPRPAARTVDDLVREAVRPFVSAWLAANLEAIVERQVRQELARRQWSAQPGIAPGARTAPQAAPTAPLAQGARTVPLAQGARTAPAAQGARTAPAAEGASTAPAVREPSARVCAHTAT